MCFSIAFHVTSLRIRHSLRWCTSSLVCSWVMKSLPFSSQRKPDSKVQMYLFVKRCCSLKHDFFNDCFFAVLIKLFWSCAESCPLAARPAWIFWLHPRGRIPSEQREIGCRCQEPIYSTSPSVRLGYLFICSFFCLCLCSIRQIISPVSLKQESIRFKAACVVCIVLFFPPFPANPRYRRCKHKHASQAHASTCTHTEPFNNRVKFDAFAALGE